MSVLTVQRLVKRFGARTAVAGFDAEIGSGEFFSVLGPSGCGKTTLLRMVAGFERPTTGRIFLRDKEITSLPPGERGVAMVFQNYALFPRMTVAENVAFGLETKRLPRPEIAKRVAGALESVHLAERSHSPVSDLSGGEQQRVAVARAIVVEPSVLLFDEPLSNLDVALRTSMRREIKDLQSRLGITTLYVTHDQGEAMSLSTRVAIMRAGMLLQVGTPVQAYEQPASPFVAEFLGSANLLEGRVDAGSGMLVMRGLQCSVPTDVLSGPGGEVVVAVKPENIVPTVEDDPEGIPGLVREVEFQGFTIGLVVQVNEVSLRSVYRPPRGSSMPAPGESMRVRIDWQRATVFGKSS
jgi:ABC-type Fe3+/spermidine/putrescine transport system ATPase subunit